MTIDYIRGFDDVGGHDEFTTEQMGKLRRWLQSDT